MRVLGEGGAGREVPVGERGGEQGEHTGAHTERKQNGQQSEEGNHFQRGGRKRFDWCLRVRWVVLLQEQLLKIFVAFA